MEDKIIINKTLWSITSKLISASDKKTIDVYRLKLREVLSEEEYDYLIKFAEKDTNPQIVKQGLINLNSPEDFEKYKSKEIDTNQLLERVLMDMQIKFKSNLKKNEVSALSGDVKSGVIAKENVQNAAECFLKSMVAYNSRLAKTKRVLNIVEEETPLQPN